MSHSRASHHAINTVSLLQFFCVIVSQLSSGRKRGQGSRRHFQESEAGRYHSAALQNRLFAKDYFWSYQGIFVLCHRTAAARLEYRTRSEGESVQSRLDEHAGDDIGVHIGRRSTILQVSLPFKGDRKRDTNGSSTVCHSGLKGVDAGRLVLPCQPSFVARAIHSDMLLVLLGKLLNRFVDGFYPALLSHRLGRVVGVCTRSIPVAHDGLGLEGGDNAVVLAQAMQQPASNHDMVTSF